MIDYKTGGIPSGPEILAGYAPQLALEGAIAQTGGFDGVAAGPVEALSYWQLSGGDPPGATRPVSADSADLIYEAAQGLARLIAEFDDPETPYMAVPDMDRQPAFKSRYSL